PPSARYRDPAPAPGAAGIQWDSWCRPGLDRREIEPQPLGGALQMPYGSRPCARRVAVGNGLVQRHVFAIYVCGKVGLVLLRVFAGDAYGGAHLQVEVL